MNPNDKDFTMTTRALPGFYGKYLRAFFNICKGMRIEGGKCINQIACQFGHDWSEFEEDSIAKYCKKSRFYKYWESVPTFCNPSMVSSLEAINFLTDSSSRKRPRANR